MIHKLDSFLLAGVFQPVVIAIGWPIKTLIRIALASALILVLVDVTRAWTGQGSIDWIGVLILFLCGPQLINPPRTTALPQLHMLVRLFMIFSFVSELLAVILLLTLSEKVGVENATLLVRALCWAAAEYFALCRDPPPRGRFAFAGAA